MKTFRISKNGYGRVGILLVVLAVITLYCGRKALGLWGGASAKATDPQLWGVNLATTFPAVLLTLVTIGAIGTIWYLVCEMLTIIEVQAGGLRLRAPGYRLFYRWEDVAAVEILSGLADDEAIILKVKTVEEAAKSSPVENTTEKPVNKNKVDAFLSEADLRKDKANRRRLKAQNQADLKAIRAHATTATGKPLNRLSRLLYPQANRPDRLLLYPVLEDRAALLEEIAAHLPHS